MLYGVVIAFPDVDRLLRDRREAAKSKTANLIFGGGGHNEHQRVRVAVASTVKMVSAETIATSSPQKFPFFEAEFLKKWRNVRDDQ
jgi:hypothetical protein